MSTYDRNHRCRTAIELFVSRPWVQFGFDGFGRMVDATEVAYVTLFLASDKAWAISGHLLIADGGAGRGVYY